LLFGSVLAEDPPLVPHLFYGSVSVEGLDDPNGLTVQARVGETIVGSTLVIGDQYGYDPHLQVEELADGTTISFYVGGDDTNQTFNFESGAQTRLDLTIEAPEEEQEEQQGGSSPTGGGFVPSPPQEDEEGGETEAEVSDELTITDVQTVAAAVTDDSVVITWSTSYPASSQVVYAREGEERNFDLNAPNFGYPNATPEYNIDPKVVDHEVPISDLVAGSNYYYRTVSRGSLAISPEYGFSTTGTSPEDLPEGQVLGEADEVVFPESETPQEQEPEIVSEEIAPEQDEFIEIPEIEMEDSVDMAEETDEEGEEDAEEAAKGSGVSYIFLIFLLLLVLVIIFWPRKRKESPTA
jgi:hypothetical protein